MTSRRDRLGFMLLLIWLVWLPIPLGSNRDWALALMCLSLGLITLVSWPRLELPNGAARAARPVLWLFAIWLVWGAMQLLPLPPVVLVALSPGAAAAYAEVGLGAAWRPMSLAPQASQSLWMLGLCLSMLFWLVLVLVRSRRRVCLLAWTLFVAAVVQAALASLLALSGQELWQVGMPHLAHGTFVNRNHLAGYLEMMLAIGIGLLVAGIAAAEPVRGWRQYLRAWSATLLGAKARLRIFLAILVITLVLTNSRMGNLAFFASLGLAALITLFLLRRKRGPVMALLVSLLAVDVLILGAWFGLDRVGERLAETLVHGDGRVELLQSSVAYARDYWLTGSGGGSFVYVFPGYREAEVSGKLVGHAHNDYLEMLLEYGLIGLVPLALIVVLCLVAAARVLRERRDPLLRGMTFATLMGVSALLIHATADFNLRIPANAACFVVLLALPWIGLTLGRRL